MNNMSTDSITSENTIVPDFQTHKGSEAPLLPRSAWNNQLAYLKVVFRAKKALDSIEKEAFVGKSLN